MQYKVNKLALTVGVSATLAFFIQLETQAQEVRPRVAALEEIVVTARRRDEGLQEVPISITAVTGDLIERVKVGGAYDLQFLVPSLTMVPSGSMKETLAPSVRGQRNSDVLGSMDPAVATYFGDTLITRASGLNQAMYDLSQVQVLKGVQGTLFGRNTTGGAVVLQPQAPVMDALEGSLTVGIGNYDNREVTGVLNVPLGDTVAMRVAGKVQQRDGFAKNLETGQRLEDRDLKAWRVSLLWTPTHTIESLTVYDHYEHDQGGTLSTLWAINPEAPAIAGHQNLSAAASQMPFFPTLAAAFPDLNALLAEQRGRSNPRHFRSDVGLNRPGGSFPTHSRLQSEVENWGVQNTTSIDLGNVTVKNMIAYRESYLDTVTDMDGGLAGLITPNQGNEYEFFSDEFQFIGTAFEDRLDWIVGLFYLKEKGDDWGNSLQFNELGMEGARVGTFSALMAQGVPFDEAMAAANAAADAANRIVGTSGDVKNESRAAYLGLNYRFNDRWTLAGGARYTEDEREYVATSNTFLVTSGVHICDFVRDGGRLPMDQCAVKGSKNYDAWTYDATLTYNFSEDAMAYGSYRHGYRTGGFGGRARSDLEMRPFDPEEVDEYEVGFKSDLTLGGMPTRLNGALFFQDYQDIQRTTPTAGDDGVIATIIENAASGEIWGGELEAQFMPTDNLSASFFYSYIDGEYKTFSGSDGRDRSSEHLVMAPKHMAGVVASYGYHLGEMGDLTYTVNFYTQSSSYINPFPDLPRHGGYSLWNARFDWENVGGSNFDVALWGRNLGGKDVRVSSMAILGTAGFASALWNDPRTYGLDITYRFDR